MMTLEQLHDRLSQWGRWYSVGETDIRRLADGLVPVSVIDEVSLGPNMLARMRQEFDATPPERSWATEPPSETQQVEAAVIACGRYYKAAAVVLRAAYGWRAPMAVKLEVLASLAPRLCDVPDKVVSRGKLKMGRWHEWKAAGEAFVMARLEHRRAA